MVKQSQKTKHNVNKDFKWWGIGLIFLGVFFIWYTNILVGAIVLMVGVVTIVLRKDWNLALIGFLIILLGGTKIIDVVMIEQSFSYFGLVLILLGIYSLKQYYKFGGKEISDKKKMLLIGIISLTLIILIPTFFSEATISTEEARLKIYGEILTSKDIGSFSWLAKEVESGAVSLEYAYDQISEFEKMVNESERKIDEASKYSLVTYTRWSELSERREYNKIYSESYRSSIPLERTLMEVCSKRKCT